jgi:hypothetical protein
VKKCLGDPNLETEVDRLARLHRWTSRTLVLLIVAPSVTVCSRIASTNCSRSSEPCGFHGVTGQGFAYADVTMSGMHGRCGYGATPVWYATMLVTHEQNETVTDAEIADDCEGHFSIVTMHGDAYDLPGMELPSGTCAFGYAR